MALGPHTGHHSQLFNSDHQVMPPSGGPGQYHDYMGGHGGSDPSGGSMSETEFEEIMSKNKSVASSAISRAVSDASAGTLSNAIYFRNLFLNIYLYIIYFRRL